MENKIYLITGSTSDIGVALIKSLELNANDIIIAHYFTSKTKIEAIKNITRAKLIPVQADLSQENLNSEFVGKIKALSLCPTHIVHLVANPIKFQKFKDFEWNDFKISIITQIKSAYEIMHEFLPKMGKRKKGRIVFILTSNTLNIPTKYAIDYVTIKYALLGFMKALAVEYADKGICINAVSPSMIETKFLTNVNEKIIEMNAMRNPMKRNATVNDVIPTIKFLLSDDNNYMTGINIPVTGGSVF